MKLFAMALASSLACASVWAANDEVNYLGDKLSFTVNVRGKVDTKGDGNTTDVCIPASTSLRGLSKLDTAANGTGLQVRLANVFGTVKDCDDDRKTVPGNTVINLSADEVKRSKPTRYGLTYGGLVVPFKYHLTGEKEFRPGGTVAPYLGYRFDRNYLGFSFKLVGFLGGAGVTVDQEVDGEKKSQTLAGISYGLGLIGTVKEEFQMGIVVGADRVSKSANYAQNGKTWIALSLGFAFNE
jgi:hypothetical protein